jgi:hypothetical protein
MMRWTPTFIFGPAASLETLTLRLPVGLWLHGGPSKGIARATATGVPGVTFTNRKRTLTVPVRFFEDEWPAVRRLIEWGQTKATFIWIPESNPYAQDQIAQAVVTLDAPRVGDVVSPIPDASYPRVSSIDLTFRQIVTGQS